MSASGYRLFSPALTFTSGPCTRQGVPRSRSLSSARTLLQILSCRSVLPTMALTRPSTSSCLIGCSASHSRYSSQLQRLSARTSDMLLGELPHGRDRLCVGPIRRALEPPPLAAVRVDQHRRRNPARPERPRGLAACVQQDRQALDLLLAVEPLDRRRAATVRRER